MAQNNFYAQRPRQTYPGILYDLLKIRKLVDEAADLAVRAQNGTSSSTLNDHRNASNGFPGVALGLGYRFGGGGAKLSPERKHRMRELATQKLAAAYRLDEVAACVATMQSTSTLDSVASLVLQRNPASTDAKYVHFFHEKIPSRTVAESTPLEPLSEVIAAEPRHPEPYRTRGVTKVFKDDHAGAVHDLTEALALCRLGQAKHSIDNLQVAIKTPIANGTKVWSRGWMAENKLDDEDQPTGLELQILYQRANQYLALACKSIEPALGYFYAAKGEQTDTQASNEPLAGPKVNTSAKMEAYRRGLEAREHLRKMAKRALRDYTAFLAHLDYAWGPADYCDSDTSSHFGNSSPHTQPYSHEDLIQASTSTALITRPPAKSRSSSSTPRSGWNSPPSPHIYAASDLFLPSIDPSIPQYPANTHSTASTTLISADSIRRTGLTPQVQAETITFHPFLLEVLHSLLLTHTLLQTAPTTLTRHAHNAARLARLADGYPFFPPARSPARADWTEILRQAGAGWLNLASSWDALCAHADAQHTSGKPSVNGAQPPAAAPDTVGAAHHAQETSEECRERIHKHAVFETLGDERVCDDVTFQRAVEARERRAWDDIKAAEAQAAVSIGIGVAPQKTLKGNGGVRADEAAVAHMDGAGILGRKDAHGRIAKDDEYHIGTERAELIARWVLEAPAVVEKTGVAGKRKKGGRPRVVPVHGCNQTGVLEARESSLSSDKVHG